MISYPFPPNASAGAVRSERFARYLREYGWSVEVVTIKARQDMFSDNERLSRLGEHVSVHFTPTWDPYLWMQDRKPSGFILRNLRSLLMRLFSFPDHMIFWVPFAVVKGLRIIRKRRIRALYTTSPPHSSHLAGFLLSKLTRIPWMADFRDPWTLNAYHEKGRIHNILLSLERVMERAVLFGAKKVLANTKANRSNLLKAFPWIGEEKIIHVPNGWEEFEIIDQLQEKGRPFTIVHSGTFYPRFKPYGLFHALAAWKHGLNENGIPTMPDLKVILLGASDSETRQIVRRLGLEEIVEIKPWVPLEEARKIMANADLLWTTLGTGKESSTYIPSKLFEYFAARRPIIGFFPKGEAESLIRETKTGVIFTSDEPLPIIREISRSVEKKDTKVMTYAPDEILLSKYHIKNITEILVRIMNNL